MTAIIQSKHVLQGVPTAPTVTLDAATTVGHLLTAVLSHDKNGTFTTPTGWTLLGTGYTGTSVSLAVFGRIADGTATDRTFTGTASTGGVGSVLTLIEWDEFPANLTVTTATFPNPVDNLAYTAATADPGAATATGFALAFATIDSMSAVWATSVFSNGYATPLTVTGDTVTGGNGQAIGAKELVSGTTTNTTATYPNSDQVVLKVIAFTSAAAPPDPATVTRSWSGAVTTSSFAVAVKGTKTLSLTVSPNADLSGATTFGPITVDANGSGKLVATGLTAGTRYYWAVVAEGVANATHRGSVKLPAVGAHSFSFWASSCAQTTTGPVFDRIAASGADFGIHMGDLHYANINTNDPALYRAAYDTVLGDSEQGPLYRAIPTVYVWDDHDYGADGSGFSSASRPAATSVYRERVPHLPLVDTDAIYHTFVRGRVRFVMLDGRADRGETTGSILGAAQRTWLEGVLSAATEPLIIINTGTGWLATQDDSWGAPTYAAERQSLAEWMVAHGLGDRVVFIAGDAHALGYDDGTNNVHGLTGPVVAAAALTSVGTTKGGTYTVPLSAGNDRYALMSVNDPGGNTITLTTTGYAAGAVYFSEDHVITIDSGTPTGYDPGWHVFDRVAADWVPVASGLLP